MRPHTRLSRCLHRRGVARSLNHCYSGGGYTSAYVQTFLPLFFLARYASRMWEVRVESRARVGRFAWRWQLRATSSASYR